MTADWSKRQRAQQQQRERREWIARAEELQRAERERLAAEQREMQRIAQLKNQWASICTARANAVLTGYQHANYYAKARRLGLIDD